MNTSAQDTRPLAEKMRPEKIEDFVGQEHLLGPGKILRQLQQGNYLPSLLLWGPPGTGKTTLARILAQSTNACFIFFSAVLGGVKEIRQIVEEARENSAHGSKTILFVDEIHRFNKSQQDAFLPHVESGLLTLIGATTENPSFHVVAPLLSRCRVITLNPLTSDNLHTILRRAIDNPEHAIEGEHYTITEAAAEYIVAMADGDARRLLNSLEIAFSLSETKEQEQMSISMTDVEEALQRKTLRYDAGGEEHYNLISALHKSLRDSDPDGALYWLGRMLQSGEDPLYIARRLIRFASEDIGNAEPQALTVALNARESFTILGSPEGDLALAQAAAYLATAPKSNAIYTGYNKVIEEIKRSGSLPVPMHIRNAPTKLMKNLGYGKNYQYAHNDSSALVDQEHLPDQLTGSLYYEPTNRGYESIIKDRLTKWRQILAQRNRKQEKQ
ncbi:MAG: replication-associated recombination protein A [Desulfobulbaceae bacterium]|uniref:Replication-associated recombination protein A n=1 Tax=Candidatus Desulfobia pelagia TaxID=2841692 RepID=A0A8J6N9Q1_9BACT|nr:replication-associated recombination protein A [Candidatus Desulfobia pelagia]